MRLKKYLNEEFDIKKVVDMDKILNTIKDDCAPFIKDWRKNKTVNMLLTGRKVDTVFVKRKVRKDRVPTDMPLEMHKVLDEWFYKKFGVRSRSNAVFCTTSRTQANSYSGITGGLYYLFPIGKYTAIGSKKIDDLFSDVDGIMWNLFREDLEKNLTKEQRQEFVEFLINFMNKAKYTNKLDLNGIGEIMVTCNEYYILNTNMITQKDLATKLHREN